MADDPHDLTRLPSGGSVSRLAALIADRLRDPKAIAKARGFLHLRLRTRCRTNADIPQLLPTDLQEAMEIARRMFPSSRAGLCLPESRFTAIAVPGHRRVRRKRCVPYVAALGATVSAERRAEHPFESNWLRWPNPHDSGCDAEKLRTCRMVD